MEPYKMEIDNSNIDSMPEYVFTTYIKPFGIYTKKIEKTEVSITGGTSFESNANVIFEINSNQFLDPFSLYLVFDVVNNSSNPLQLDGSAHSLIRDLTVRRKVDGVKIEEVKDYNDIMNIFFDIHLTRKERFERHENEGFGYNEYGTNETIIYDQYTPKKNIIEDNFNIKDVKNSEYFKKEDIEKAIKEKEWNIQTEQEELYNISEWSEAINGKLAPVKTPIDVWNNTINEKNFKVPLFLKSIGHYITDDNYKFVPLKILGPIQIIVQFDPFGLYAPVLVSKKEYFNFLETKDTSLIFGKVNTRAERNFFFKNVHLEYNLYSFNESVEQKIYRQVYANNWCTDYNGIQLLNTFYLTPFPSFDATTSFKDKTQIRAIYAAVKTNLYQKNAFSRRFARHNKGINRFVFEYKNLTLPEAINDKKRNSLETTGFVNGEYFWEQLSKAMSNPQGVLTKANFFLNRSLSETVALRVYSDANNIQLDTDYTDLLTFVDKNWFEKYMARARAKKLKNILLTDYNKTREEEEIEDWKGLMPEFQNKSLFTINFDEMFNSYGRYRVGLDVNPEDKFKLTIHRIDGFEEYDPFIGCRSIFNYLCIYAEYYETIFLDGKLGVYKQLLIK